MMKRKRAHVPSEDFWPESLLRQKTIESARKIVTKFQGPETSTKLLEKGIEKDSLFYVLLSSSADKTSDVIPILQTKNFLVYFAYVTLFLVKVEKCSEDKENLDCFRILYIKHVLPACNWMRNDLENHLTKVPAVPTPSIKQLQARIKKLLTMVT